VSSVRDLEELEKSASIGTNSWLRGIMKGRVTLEELAAFVLDKELRIEFTMLRLLNLRDREFELQSCFFLKF